MPVAKESGEIESFFFLHARSWCIWISRNSIIFRNKMLALLVMSWQWFLHRSGKHFGLFFSLWCINLRNVFWMHWSNIRDVGFVDKKRDFFGLEHNIFILLGVHLV